MIYKFYYDTDVNNISYILEKITIFIYSGNEKYNIDKFIYKILNKEDINNIYKLKWKWKLFCLFLSFFYIYIIILKKSVFIYRLS